MEIFLRFTVETGHRHPHLHAGIENYAGLLAQMGHSPEDVQARLGALLRALGIRLGQ